jgi:hypothetical protein
MLGSGGHREDPKGSVRPARTGAQTSLSDQGAKELDLGAEDPEKGGFGLNVLLPSEGFVWSLQTFSFQSVCQLSAFRRLASLTTALEMADATHAIRN